MTLVEWIVGRLDRDDRTLFLERLRKWPGVVRGILERGPQGWTLCVLETHSPDAPPAEYGFLMQVEFYEHMVPQVSGLLRRPYFAEMVMELLEAGK
jgi:hypothetical protein